MIRMASSSSSIWTTKRRFQRVSIPRIASRASSFRLASLTLQERIKKGLCGLGKRDPVMLTLIHQRFVCVPDKTNTMQLKARVHARQLIQGDIQCQYVLTAKHYFAVVLRRRSVAHARWVRPVSGTLAKTAAPAWTSPRATRRRGPRRGRRAG